MQRQPHEAIYDTSLSNACPSVVPCKNQQLLERTVAADQNVTAGAELDAQTEPAATFLDFQDVVASVEHDCTVELPDDVGRNADPVGMAAVGNCKDQMEFPLGANQCKPQVRRRETSNGTARRPWRWWS